MFRFFAGRYQQPKLDCAADRRISQTLRASNMQKYLILVSIFLSIFSSVAHSQIHSNEIAQIELERDHGVHWDALTEWWYFVGHLKSATGRTFGYQLTFFKFSVIGYFTHVAITDDQGKKFSFIRQFYTPAEIYLGANDVYLKFGDATAVQTSAGSFSIAGAVPRGKFELKLDSTTAPLFVGGTGVFTMPDGNDSMYYSITNLSTTGTLKFDNETLVVTGQSWMDHQWGPFAVVDSKWDWFSIQTDDGDAYNFFSFRNPDDTTMRQYISIVRANGGSEYYSEVELKRLNWFTSPSTGNLYVTKWELNLPEIGETFELEATVQNQEVFASFIFDLAPTYWEGRCHVVRKIGDNRTTGVAYSEHFPYLRRITH